ncbi:uncharacterized protein LOC144562475 isoform X2 [Carex rostrata]
MTNSTPMTSTSNDHCSTEEWDEIRCPICMDHPHNAVRLDCSSINCRSFICNTSYHHSNCLDRFKRSPVQNITNNNNEENVIELKCPMCRGDVMGWTVNEEARQHLDKKSRDCSRNKCEFHGNYEELKRHARKDHPFNRSVEVDPLRQHQWRRLEQQQELGDLMSAIRSEIPGAVVVGDYAVEADEVSSLNDVTVGNSDGSGSLWTTLVLGPVMGSPIRSSLEESRESHVEPSTGHPSRRRRRRYLWGEILLGLQYDDDSRGRSESQDDGDVYDDNGSDDTTRVRRQRLDGDDGTFARIGHIGGDTAQRDDDDGGGGGGDDDDDGDSDDGTDMLPR